MYTFSEKANFRAKKVSLILGPSLDNEFDTKILYDIRRLLFQFQSRIVDDYLEPVSHDSSSGQLVLKRTMKPGPASSPKLNKTKNSNDASKNMCLYSPYKNIIVPS